MNGDLISRKAFIDFLDCGHLVAPEEAFYSESDVLSLIKSRPSVDAVVLPCKVGDTVWGIRNYKGVNHPQQGKVDQMYYTNDMRLHIKIKHICIGEWGKKIFPTREEAEAALKERADK